MLVQFFFSNRQTEYMATYLNGCSCRRVFHMWDILMFRRSQKQKIEEANTHICGVEGYLSQGKSLRYSLHEYLPITSAFCVEATNHASSPNFPNLYLERNISFGKPHATDTKCGLTFLFGSTTVENPLRNARENRRVVQQIDCIFFLNYLLFICFGFLFLLFNPKCFTSFNFTQFAQFD